jgi:hypothetical protein
MSIQVSFMSEGGSGAPVPDHDDTFAGPVTRTNAMNVKRPIHAAAKINVQNFEARPYDESGSPALVDLRLTETFTGDIDGTSAVRALQVRHNDGSASTVSLQRFAGKLHGMEGTCVLQGSGIIENGKIKATWSVVPRSGTADLEGLRGSGGFEGEFGKGSDGTLDYWFE